VKIDFIDLLLVAVIALLVLGPWGGVAGPSTKVTAVTYTYDDKQHGVPPPVAAALNTLNRQGIVATLDEVDTTDASGEVPDQYKVSRPAAIAAGLPSLPVMAGGKVLRVVKDPKTFEAVEAAAK
jgi:hypothetical protein